jgi:ERCC4-type nuclease
VIEDKSLGLDEKLERVQKYMNEKRKEVADSYNSLQQEFGPYCQEIGERMIEKLRQHFESTITGSNESAALA